LKSQAPPTHPLHVGVPHWQAGSGEPPTQFPLQSIAPPQLAVVSQLSPRFIGSWQEDQVLSVSQTSIEH
jgi:hypothetical protein